MYVYDCIVHDVLAYIILGLHFVFLMMQFLTDKNEIQRVRIVHLDLK